MKERVSGKVAHASRLVAVLWGVALAPLCVQAMEEPVNLSVITHIRQEGFDRSEVMKTLSYLTDEIGPRLTGSPGLKNANDWTLQKFNQLGLKNARLEGFEFGPGWTPVHSVVHMTAPRVEQLYAQPISWHPGTNGALTAQLFHAPMEETRDFKKYKGKLAGKIVLVDAVSPPTIPVNEVFIRRTEEDLVKSRNYRIPNGEAQDDFDWWVEYRSFQYKLEKFLASEGAVGMVRRSPRDAMLLEASGYQHMPEHLPTIPAVQMASEHYNRAVRLLKHTSDVSMSMDIQVTFHKEDTKSYSTLADIPGDGRASEVVMAGAHLDSWVLGDGAADNGAGVAVVMEAARILKAIGIKPKRTIRFALWGGEEQGYFGSQQYVMDHLAARPENKDDSLQYMGPYEKYFDQFPVTYKPEFDRFSAYFNLDNGAGRIRGIYGESNLAAGAIFEAWLRPFHDIGAKVVSMNTSGGTDHEVFDDIGLPAFQFIQDPLDYDARIHHTQVDTFEHIQAEDLKQAAVILASFLYHAAMRDERLPRKPLPVGESD